MLSDAAIRAAGQALAQAAHPPARVLLFGSRAWGEPRPDSDVDFLVIEAHVPSTVTEMVRLRDAVPQLGVAVDVLVVSAAAAARPDATLGPVIPRALRHGLLVGRSP